MSVLARSVLTEEVSIDRLAITSAAVLGALFGSAYAGATQAQTAKDLVGTWQVVSTVSVAPDGTKSAESETK